MSLKIDWQEILIEAGSHIIEESIRNLAEEIKRMQSQTMSVSVVTPGTVEGSIVEPVTDPTRLLEAKEMSK